MRDHIRDLLRYFGLSRVPGARVMRPRQRLDRNRRKLTLDELESRLAPSVTTSGTSVDFLVDIDAAENISVGRTDNFKLRVTVEGSGDLDIQQAASSIEKLTITATGKGSMAGFSYTINQTGAKTTGAVPSGWSAASPNTCWVVKKGGLC